MKPQYNTEAGYARLPQKAISANLNQRTGVTISMQLNREVWQMTESAGVMAVAWLVTEKCHAEEAVRRSINPLTSREKLQHHLEVISPKEISVIQE